MIDSHDQLRKALAHHKQSITAVRTAVFSALQDKGPLTMAELIKACGDGIDRASVYRTVKLFEQLGIAQRLQIGWKYRIELSNDFQHHHHHLYCIKCGTVIAMPEDIQLEARLQILASNINFTPEDHQIEIRGLCEKCTKE